MKIAKWNGQVIAKTDTFEMVEGNVYFPPESIHAKFFQPNDKTTFCGWKGTAQYYDIVVDGQTNESAAWYYPETKDAAQHIKDYVAFWRGVVVEDE